MADLIDAADYEVFCLLAREFNEWVSSKRVFAPAHAPSDARGDRPGDEFNRRGDWGELLTAHGWKVDRTSGEVTYWTRPDKDRGVSATTGKCKTEASGDLLYVFSSNAHPFDSDAAYSKFAAYSLLAHGGDYSEAATELRKQGYAPSPLSVVWPEPEAAPDEADDVAGIDDLKKAGAEIKWVWPGWVQRGVVTAVAAEGGTGKTRFMADLVRRVRHNVGWPDGVPVEAEAGRWIALWVVSDNHHDEMVSLCDDFGITDCVKLNATRADPYGGVTLDLAEDFAALEKRVKAVKPLFVIVDTVGNATDRNLSRQEDAKAFYQPLQLIARRQGVAMMALTHLNANGKVLGRRALEKVRTCIRMNGDGNKDSRERRLEITKSNSLKPPAKGITMGTNGNEYHDNPCPAPEDQDGGKAEKASPRAVECTDWLKKLIDEKPRPVKEMREMAEMKGFSADTLYKAMRTLGLEEVPINGRKWWRNPVAAEAA